MTKKKRDLNNLFTKILYFGLLPVSVFFIISSKKILFGFSQAFIYPLLAFIALTFIYFILRKIKLQQYSLLVTIAVWLDFVGVLGPYWNIPLYDKFLHFFVPMILGSMVYSYEKRKRFDNPVFAFFTTLGLLALFEIFEWLIEITTGFPMLGVLNTNANYILSPISDTMSDMLVGSSGIIVGLYIKHFYDKKKLSK